MKTPSKCIAPHKKRPSPEGFRAVRSIAPANTQQFKTNQTPLALPRLNMRAEGSRASHSHT